MPYSTLDKEISLLNHRGGCIIIIAALFWVFGAYLWEMKEQAAELNRLSQEAVYASKAKSEFLSNMSHDIRTPMNAITGMTAIAIANIDNRQKVENCLKKINLSSKHLLALINDVLDMSKIESGKMTLSMEQVSLREVIDGIVNILQPQLHTKNQSIAGLDWAENGQICLEKFAQSPPGYYNAVLMDLRMPVMTGLEASMAIHALEQPDAAAVPIIAITADAFAEDIQNCLNSGMNAHISKPVDIDEATQILEKYV